jgi:hypothetical protein
LQRITASINQTPGVSAILQDNKPDELRIVVSTLGATIKIEVSPVARGTLYEPEIKAVVEKVEAEFGYAELQVVSLPDLYGGKLCAAMDRQHPRDIYDVKLLLDNEGITRDIFVGFLTYVLSHPRPINEVLWPNWKDLSLPFLNEFEGMTNKVIGLEELEQARLQMLIALQSNFTNQDIHFLLSFKAGKPDWDLFDVPTIANLPAVRWKLMNIQKLEQNSEKHKEQLAKLSTVLDEWKKKPL